MWNKFCIKDSEDIDFISEAFNLLKEPNRIKILCILSKSKKLCVNELVDALDLKQNLVSHHLGMFKRIWLVESERDVTKVYYRIDKTNFKKLKKIVWNIFNL